MGAKSLVILATLLFVASGARADPAAGAEVGAGSAELCIYVPLSTECQGGDGGQVSFGDIRLVVWLGGEAIVCLEGATVCKLLDQVVRLDTMSA